MPFNKKEFMKTEMKPRMGEVPVPDLKIFFADGEKPVWKVRNLTGHELGIINEAAARNESISAIIDGIVSTSDKDKVEAIKAALGLGNSTPQDVARRIEMLMVGSVEPTVNRELAVKLCTHHPIEFWQITQKITELTGKGSEIKKKQKDSGTTPT